jgi:hypothetical protein
VAIDGTYNIEADTPMGKQAGTITLKTDGNSLSGTYTSFMGTESFTGGTVSGNDFKFSVSLNTPMGKIDLEFSGTVSGNEISGKSTAGAFGTSPFKGTRA